jgi:hypothetical protein
MSNKRKSSTKQRPQFTKDLDSRRLSASDPQFDVDTDSLQNPPLRKPSDEQPDEQLNNIGFVVELFLNDRGQVQLTQALQVKSAEGEVWDGWDENRLIDFFVRHASLRLPATVISRTQGESDAASLKTLNIFLDKLRRDFDLLGTQGKRFDLCVNKTHGFRAYIACEGESVPIDVPRALLKDLDVETLDVMMKTALTLNLTKKAKAKSPEPRQAEAAIETPKEAPPPLPERRKVDVISTRSESPCRILKSGESFKLRFPLDLAAPKNEAAPASDLISYPASYKASVAALLWDDPSHQPLNLNAGAVKQADKSLLIEITEQELPPGVYRFKADLEFGFERAESSGRDSLTSGFVQVV